MPSHPASESQLSRWMSRVHALLLLLDSLWTPISVIVDTLQIQQKKSCCFQGWKRYIIDFINDYENMKIFTDVQPQLLDNLWIKGFFPYPHYIPLYPIILRSIHHHSQVSRNINIHWSPISFLDRSSMLVKKLFRQRRAVRQLIFQHGKHLLPQDGMANIQYVWLNRMGPQFVGLVAPITFKLIGGIWL